MIEVVYHRKYHRLTAKGHALSGEAGHDLVCASVTILAGTLKANVDNMAEVKQVRDAKTELKAGYAEIACKPIPRFEAPVTLAFDSICAGFELLAYTYPENISYEIRG